MSRSSLFLAVLAALAGQLGCRPERESAEDAALRLGHMVAVRGFESALAFRPPRSKSNLSADQFAVLSRALDLTIARGSLAAAASPDEERETIRSVMGPDGKPREVSRTPIDRATATHRLIDLTGRFDDGTPFTVSLTMLAGEDGWKTDLLDVLIKLARARFPDDRRRGSAWVRALEEAQLEKLVMDSGAEIPVELLRQQATGTLPPGPGAEGAQE